MVQDGAGLVLKLNAAHSPHPCPGGTSPSKLPRFHTTTDEMIKRTFSSACMCVCVCVCIPKMCF